MARFFLLSPWPGSSHDQGSPGFETSLWGGLPGSLDANVGCWGADAVVAAELADEGGDLVVFANAAGHGDDSLSLTENAGMNG